MKNVTFLLAVALMMVGCTTDYITIDDSTDVAEKRVTFDVNNGNWSVTRSLETSDVLTKLTITALDAGDNVVGECTIENVPVTVNRITDCTGTIAGGKGAVTTTILVNPDWDGIDSYTF